MVHFVAILNFSSLSSHSSRKHRTMGNWGHGKLKRSKQRKCRTNEKCVCRNMIRRLFYASLKLSMHQKSGDNVEVEEVRGGSLYRQTKR